MKAPRHPSVRTGPLLSAAGIVFLILMLALPPYLEAGSSPQSLSLLQPAVAIPTNTPGGAAIQTPTPPAPSGPTPSLSDTPAAPQAGACNQDAAVAPQDWTLGLCETFQDATNGWRTDPNSSDFGTVSFELGQGVYRWTVNTPKGLFQSETPAMNALSDFYASTTARITSGPDTLAYALVFRHVDGDNYYVFQVNDAKKFAVYLQYKGQWQTLQDLTDTDAVKPGQDNLLAVKAEKSTLTFYINNQQVAQFNDSRLTSGSVGLGINADANVQGVEEFTHFEVRTAPGTPAVAITPSAAAVATPAPAGGTPVPVSSAACNQDAAVAPQDWTLGLCDGFQDAANGWSTKESSSDYGTVDFEIGQGAYRWTISSTKSMFHEELPAMNAISDFYASTTARLTKGPAATDYALLFRYVDSSNFYSFQAGDDKRFGVFLLYKGQWQTLQDYTDSDAIRPGQANLLAVKAQKSALTFFINNQQVAQFNDSRLSSGQVGLGSNLDANVQATIEFTNLEVRTAPGMPAVAITPSAAVATPAPVGGTPAPVSSAACNLDTAVAPQSWPLGLCDAFQDNSSGWPTKGSNDEYGTVNWRIGQGVYSWSINSLKGFFQQTRPSMSAVSDFYASTVARLTSGPDTTDYALVFRYVDNNNFYVFQVSDAKKFAVFLLYKGQWQTLQDSTDSDAVKPGQPNLLAVQAHKSSLTFYINNQQVAQFSDSRLTSGQVGVGLNVDANVQVTVEFSSFEVRTAPGAPAVAITPIAASTPAITPTPAPAGGTPGASSSTACNQDAAVAPQDWPLGLCDAFQDNTSGWPNASSNDDYGKVSHDLSGGVYSWTVSSLKSLFHSGTPNMNSLSDFYASTTAHRTSGPNAVDYALLFRYLDSDNFYAFQVEDTGQFAVFLLYKGQWQTLQDYTSNDAIKPDQANLLAVKAQKSTLTFYINNQQVAQFSDSRIPRGLVGLGVDVAANVQTTVEFTDLAIRTAPGAPTVAITPTR